jgi:GNAT superfamily N-acetyltransferase
MPDAPTVYMATTPESIARCFPVMQELRTALTSEEEFVARVQQQQTEGFQLAFLERDGQIVTVTGFRIQHMLASGLTLYVDDLVTGDAFRSQGNGKIVLDWLIETARAKGCETFSLDSGTHRRDAHAFYFRERMRVTSFHFALPLN